MLDGRISPTLGTADSLLVLEEDSSWIMPLNGKKIPALLKGLEIDVLICSSIGNCMMDLLQTMKITVIPGVVCSVEEAEDRYRAGTLTAGENYSCTSHSRSCGECPGYF